jgi:hypothetical protein
MNVAKCQLKDVIPKLDDGRTRCFQIMSGWMRIWDPETPIGDEENERMILKAKPGLWIPRALSPGGPEPLVHVLYANHAVVDQEQRAEYLDMTNWKAIPEYVKIKGNYCSLIDLAYLDDAQNDWKDVIAPTLVKHSEATPMAINQFGLVVPSGYGPGEYFGSVYEQDGEVVGIAIAFIKDTASSPIIN